MELIFHWLIVLSTCFASTLSCGIFHKMLHPHGHMFTRAALKTHSWLTIGYHRVFFVIHILVGDCHNPLGESLCLSTSRKGRQWRHTILKTLLIWVCLISSLQRAGFQFWLTSACSAMCDCATNSLKPPDIGLWRERKRGKERRELGVMPRYLVLLNCIDWYL